MLYRVGICVAAVSVLVLAPSAARTEATPDSASTLRALDLFSEVFERVRSDYVDPVTDDKIIDAALNGMLSGLDPHSRYLNAQAYRDFQTVTQGEFGGVGIEVTPEEGALRVVSPIDDTPAARAGIRPGDLIGLIDGQPVGEMSLQDAVDRMRGQIGTQVKLTLRREGREPFEITLSRAKIVVQAVKARLQDNVEYIRVASFSENAAKGVDDALAKARQQAGDRLVGVVLDLRNDPGGLLDEAVSIAGDFLDGGEVVSTRGRRADDMHRYNAKPKGDRIRNLPMVVLINGGSASASEIVSGALQDRHRAVVLGTKSFGKGSVQTVIPIKDAGAMVLTTARYYTPAGRSIQAKGIDPDIVVEPAKIEKLAAETVLHESDLRGALRNPDAAKAAPATAAAAPATATTAPPPNVPPGTTPAATSQGEHGSDATDASAIGGPDDYQLARAFDLIKGITLFQHTIN
ncbi:MAG: peptidase [Rhodospirillales bacterium]|nr:peptidase [Rhodospirillales bacterium]